jgi:biopolymer transport protein ExbB/TolQ
MERAAATTRQDLASGLGSLALIASVAPLLGLLLQAPLLVGLFVGCGCGGDGWIRRAVIFDGMANSLIPPLFGLAIAIPACIAYRQFTATVKTFSAEMNGAMLLLAELNARCGVRIGRNG